jgi:hypothetical protein
MESYTEPLAQKVMGVHQKLIKWFKQNPNEWRPEVDEYIIKCSNGRLRVFQTFFETPEGCLSGNFRTQVLQEKDLIAMYPQYIESVQNLPSDTYCYLFTCNGALKNRTHALISQTFIKI